MTADEAINLEYFFPVQLSTGEWAALQQMAFTCGLFVGLDATGYRTRFCYPDMAAALAALIEWDGTGDPPGPWIKQKGLKGGDRNNPATFKGVPIVDGEANDT